jgi:hypothetical protein
MLGTIVLQLFTNYVITQIDTLIANEHRRPGNQLTDFMLALSAERTIQQFSVFAFSGSIVGHSTTPLVTVARLKMKPQTRYCKSFPGNPCGCLVNETNRLISQLF